MSEQSEFFKKTDDSPIFIGTANNIPEAEFIKNLFIKKNIPLFHTPSTSTVLYGQFEGLNITVRKKDVKKALEILKANGINPESLGDDPYFFPYKRDSNRKTLNPFFIIILIFSIVFIVIFLKLVF